MQFRESGNRGSDQFSLLSACMGPQRAQIHNPSLRKQDRLHFYTITYTRRYTTSIISRDLSFFCFFFEQSTQEEGKWEFTFDRRKARWPLLPQYCRYTRIRANAGLLRSWIRSYIFYLLIRSLMRSNNHAYDTLHEIPLKQWGKDVNMFA